MNPTTKFQTLQRLVRILGHKRSRRLAGWAGQRVASRAMGVKVQNHIANLAMVNVELSESERTALSNAAIGNYARYFVDLIALGSSTAAAIDEGFSVSGYEHIQASLDSGKGPILVLPHMGSWEWGAAWLAKVAGEKVVAVVEQLEPQEVFDWFVETRNSYGIEVVGLGDDSFKKISAAVNENKIVCLLSDRDLGSKSVDVDMFGNTLKIPVGPALLAKRTGAQLIPTAVYITETGAHCEILPPVSDAVVEQSSPVQITQAVGEALAQLIRAKPDQWYVLERLVE